MARNLLQHHDVLTKLSQIVKTGLSGMAASIIDFAALIALVELASISIVVAALLAAAAGAVVGFVITKLWAFQDREPADPRQITAYTAVALGNAFLVAVVLKLLVAMAGVVYPIAKVLASIVAFALWSYPAQARWVFAKGERYAM